MNHKSAMKGQDTTKTQSDHVQYIMYSKFDQDFTPNITILMAVLKQFVTHNIITLSTLPKLLG